MKVFKHLQLISIKNPIFNVPLKIFCSIIEKNRMLADFYIPTISNNMTIAVQKNHLVGQFWSFLKNGILGIYREPDRRYFLFCIIDDH